MRVERAGAFSGGYGRGWLAFNPVTEVGSWHPSWGEAMRTANTQARAEFARSLGIDLKTLDRIEPYV